MKIKLEREGESVIAMDVELPAKLDLKGKTHVEFEKLLSISVSGEGKAELGLPLRAAVKSIRLEGDATIVIEPEGVPAFKIPRKVPRGKVVTKVLGALEPGPERALSSYELASKLGLEERQVRTTLGRLAKKQLIGVLGEKGEYKYYKTDVTTKDPNDVRSAEIPVIEREEKR